MNEGDPVLISERFQKVEGLAADKPCLIVAKRVKRSREFLRRQAEIEGQSKIERYLQPLRTEVGEGAIYLSTLNDFAAGRRSAWQVLGPEPHDAVFSNGIVWGAFCGSVRAIDPRSGRVGPAISNKRFTNLHSLSALPERNLLLVANTGRDELLELDLTTGAIEWIWRPSDHDWNLGPFGVVIVSSAGRARAIGLEGVNPVAAQARLRAGAPREGWAIIADPERIEHPLGLEKWQRVAEPNWAGYERNGTAILCTSFCGDAILRIDRNSGQIVNKRVGYLWPHAIIDTGQGDFVITDTGRAHVHFVDADLNVRQIYSFAELETDDIGASQREWLQFTTPFDSNHTFVSVDSRRSKIFVWSPQARIYSEYSVPRSILVKSVQAAGWAS